MEHVLSNYGTLDLSRRAALKRAQPSTTASAASHLHHFTPPHRTRRAARALAAVSRDVCACRRCCRQCSAVSCAHASQVCASQHMLLDKVSPHAHARTQRARHPHTHHTHTTAAWRSTSRCRARLGFRRNAGMACGGGWRGGLRSM